MRRKLVAGNWKMNGRAADLVELHKINEVAYHATVDVAICPPATLISEAHAAAPSVWIAGQDCHAAVSGAYTGWLSAEMLRDVGASMVIVGHSERRTGARETNEDVRGKAQAGLDAGLLPIVCVGESEDDRSTGRHVDHVLSQLEGSLPSGFDERTIVAYEPIWAVGTGQIATPADVEEMHAAIRSVVGEQVRILYGGSVKGENAADLFATANVDGALVGGASLTAAQFIPIIEAAMRA